MVKLNSVVSYDIKVHSGMPQGSHLGPLLFILFINDLPTIFDTTINVLLFADDAKVFSVITSQFDCIKLQLYLEKLNKWSKLNELPLNIDKCQVISFSRKKEPIIFNYKLGNTILNRVDYIKDVGIIF